MTRLLFQWFLTRVARRRTTLLQALPCAAGIALGAASALAQTSPLSRTPLWSSASSQTTLGVALGDVDRDGDLDLVCANDRLLSSLFRNDGGLLTATPAWFSSSAPPQQTVALGDVDGDGLLDAIFSGPQGATLHSGDGTAFSETPTWNSSGASLVSAIALGDVDQDGDLDLLCGSTPDHFGLLLNVDGALEQTPVWEAGATSAIALGDLDGDDDLDLVCTTERHVRLYRNTGGIFATTHDWESQSFLNTSALALGDVDGDGDLDLVCGNSGDANHLYLNVGGSFPLLPDWVAPIRLETRSIALADMDGDGDLDLACGINGAPSVVFRWKEGGFEAEAAWESDADPTTSVAWGDLDGDGDPELVCGNEVQTATAYDNLRPTLAEAADWTGTSRARDVALGDIDQDGDLDLVFGGNSAGSDALYRNDGGTIGAAPIWTPSVRAKTASVALGDIDGDGDLDLVCGRPDVPNALFRNIGGTFETEPIWSAVAAESTTSVALGDLDRDGDLDLACSNTGRSRAYRNAGGTFEAEPFWRSEEPTFGSGIALADLNHDQFLDIVAGGRLYPNIDGTLSPTATWIAGLSFEPPHDVAIGDVNGDFHLDVVFANGPRVNTLYLNDGITLGPRTEWYPEIPDGTQGIALADVDGDGDLDAVGAGNGENGRNVLYENRNNRLQPAPSWTPRDSSASNAVAVGDLDSDGDLDLVFASEAPTVFSIPGIQRPPSPADPAAPAYQLPNNAARLQGVQLGTENPGVRRVRFTGLDVESDSLWIFPEYQPLGGGEWQLLREVGARFRERLIGPFGTSPAGTPGEFLWDLSTLPLVRQSIAIRLRAISNPGRAGAIQYVPWYYADAGIVEVRRPVLEAPVENIVFPVVTVGDTVPASIRLANAGNEALEIHSITVPFPESMDLDVVPPFTIAPGESRYLEMTYHPRVATKQAGILEIHTNDPAAPTFQIGLVTETLDLLVRTHALADVDSVPLGQSLAIQTIPATGVRIEKGVLFYKAPGIGVFKEVEMQRVAGDTDLTSPLFGIIPEEEVTELGLEYYVEVENSGIQATDPFGAPSNAFHQAVASPLGISADPQPNSPFGFLAGRDINVQVSVPQGSQFVLGALHYRLGGASSYAHDSLLVGDPLPTGSIPDSLVGPRGVEFWAEVRTLTRTLTDPGQNPQEHPATLRVRVQNMSEPIEHPAQRYRLLSVPLDFGEFAGTLAALLADEGEFGPYDPKRWRAFRYETGRGTVELTTDLAAVFRPVPGRAFWLISSASHRIDTAPIEGVSTPTGSPFRMVLASGWNAIGNPFAFPVAWSDVRSSIALDPPIAFDPARGAIGDYSDVAPSVLQPFEGYFVENPSSAPETLWVEPKEAVGSTLASALPPSSQSASPLAWRLQLVAQVESGARDGANIFGVDALAADEHDALDAREPPATPGDWVQLYFTNRDWQDRPGAYRRDIRTPQGDGHAWDFEVRSATPAAPVDLELLATALLPADLALVLVDLEQGSRVELRGSDGGLQAHRILAFGGDRPYRLRLLAGTRAWVDRASETETQIPAQFALEQNAPNPFNGGTRFRFGLPQAEAVTIEIFDVQGRRVRSLADRERLPAGWHVRLWDGANAAGRPAASGVYFFRLRAGAQVATRRMVMLQ